jgi:hypothetical protein
MQPLLFNKKLITVKLETTYGVDPTPDGSNAIVTKGLTINPYEGNKVSRDVDSASLGNDIEINTAPYVTVSFDVEIAGSGAAGIAPGYGPILRACGLSETITADTSVEYQPVSDSFESAAIYFYQSGQLHKATGCRGSVKFSLSKGSLPMMSFTFTGLWHPPVTQASPAGVDTSSFKTPLPVNAANTVLTIDSYAAHAESVDTDIANTVTFRDVIGNQSVILTDRAPAGSLAVEAPDLATKDFFSAAASHNGVTTVPLSVIHGTVAGSIVEIAAPKVQLSSISMGDSDGLLTYTMDMRLIPTDAGDDEFVLTVR